MKKNTCIIILVMLTAVFQWSCQNETVNPETATGHDQPTDLRAPGGNGNGGGNGGGGNGGGGNGGGGGGSVAIYAVQYTGSADGSTGIVTSDVAYLKVTESTGKTTGLHSICDGSFASMTEVLVSTTLYGLNDLFTYLTPPVTCYDDYECSWSVSMTQFDKKKLPHRLKATFWFADPAAPGGNPRFTMWGTINGEFLPTTSTPTTIEFDKWQVDYGNGYSGGDPACDHETTFFADDNIPHQSMSITLIDNPDVVALCASKPGCTN